MNYQLNKIIYPEYTHFVVTGTDTIENSEEYWMDIITFCIENNIKKILVEEAMEGSGEIIDLYFAIEKIANVIDRQLKIAFFDHYFDAHNNFSETVAINRGINARVFDSIENAKKWLLED